MKVGTIVSPWRYDAVAGDALKLAAALDEDQMEIESIVLKILGTTHQRKDL